MMKFTNKLGLMLGYCVVAICCVLAQHAAVAAKPVAPIAIEYEFAGPLSVGLPVEVTIRIDADAPMSDVELEFRGDDGLQLNLLATTQRIAVIDEPSTTTITVVPLAQELLYLTVSVEAELNGARQARTVLIPFRLAAERRKGTSAVLKVEQSGELIHSLPASARPSGRLR